MLTYVFVKNMINSADTGIPGVTYWDFVTELFRPMSPAAMFTHAVLGAVTEYHEAAISTDEVNFVEECGDYLFFTVAALQRLVEVDFGDDDLFEVALNLAQDAEKFLPEMDLEDHSRPDINHADVAQFTFAPVLDVAKRWLAYDKSPTAEQAKMCAIHLTYGLLMLHNRTTELQDLGDFEVVVQKLVRSNVAKLRHRYKGGFSIDKALQRDTQAEYKAVEGLI